MMRSSTFKVLAVAMMLAVATHSAGAARMLLKKPPITVTSSTDFYGVTSADGKSKSKIDAAADSAANTGTVLNAGFVEVGAASKGTNTAAAVGGTTISQTTTYFKKNGNVKKVDAGTFVTAGGGAVYDSKGKAKAGVVAGAITLTDKTKSLALTEGYTKTKSTGGGGALVGTVLDTWQTGASSGAIAGTGAEFAFKGTGEGVAGAGNLVATDGPNGAAVAETVGGVASSGKAGGDGSVSQLVAVEQGPQGTAAIATQDLSAGSIGTGAAAVEGSSSVAVKKGSSQASASAGVSASSSGTNSKAASSTTITSTVT